jgi:DNA-binding response OmpR family regulator
MMTYTAEQPRTMAPPSHILIVEDNDALVTGLRTSFEVEGYEVDRVGDGEAALEWLASHHPDLIILDLMLPTTSGFDVLRRYRAMNGTAAVLILSARDQEVDKVQGFRIGADDYVVKPVGLLELLARIEAMLRRVRDARPQPGPGDGPVRHTFGEVTVDMRTRTVYRGREVVDLTPMEFDLLVFLLRADGNIVSRETLMRQVWRYTPGLTSRTVDQHVARLRHKIERDPAEPRHILTVRKAGYRLEA